MTGLTGSPPSRGISPPAAGRAFWGSPSGHWVWCPVADL